MLAAWRGISLYSAYVQLRPVGAMPFLILTPFVYLLLFVPAMAGFVQDVTYRSQPVPYADFVLPGIVTMTMFNSSGVAAFVIHNSRDSGELEVLFAGPIPRWMSLVAQVQAVVLRGLLQGMVTLVAGFFLLPPSAVSPGNLLWAMAIAVLVCASFSLVFICMASLMRSGDVFNWAMQLLNLPLLFSAPVFYPKEGLPDWLNVLSELNPMTYAVEGVRGALLGAELGYQLVNLLVLAGMLAAGLVFGLWAFPRAVR